MNTEEDFYKNVRNKILLEIIPVKRYKHRKPSEERTDERRRKDNERSRKSYNKRKDDPEFKKKQKEKNKKKYEARKNDPIKWAKYLEQCRLSKLRRKTAA